MIKNIIKSKARFIRERKEIFLIAALGSVLASLRLPECLLWMDEFFSINIINNPLLGIWSFKSHPNGFYFNSAPPLYETLMNLLSNISSGEMFYRQVSVFFYALTLYFLYELAKHISDKRTALIAAFFAAMNYGYIFHAKMIRAYSFLNVLVIISALLFLRSISSPGRRKDILCLTAVNTLILYTSYFGAIIIAVEAAFALFWLKGKSLKDLLLSLAVTGISFVPWAGHFIRDIKKEPALKAAGLDWMYFFQVLSGRLEHGIFFNKTVWTAYAVILAGALAFLTFKTKGSKQEKKPLLFLGVTAVFPLFLINALTLKAGGDFFRARYLLCFMFGWFILAAWAIKKAPKTIALILFCFVTVSSGLAVYDYINADYDSFWLARLAVISREARHFPIEKEDKVVVEIEDALFVPIFVRYFYGPWAFKQVPLSRNSKKLNDLAKKNGGQYEFFYNVVGIKEEHNFKSTENLLNADWLYLIYSDWFKKEWGMPFRQQYEQRLVSLGVKEYLKLARKTEKSGFVLEVYQVIKAQDAASERADKRQE